MQTIPTEYKQAGCVMRLQKRDGNVAMYRSVMGDYWEIHRVQVRPAEKAFGKDYPERELLASNEQFGSLGWACNSQERADLRFQNAIALDNLAKYRQDAAEVPQGASKGDSDSQEGSD